MLTPATIEELASILREAAGARRSIRIAGHGGKTRMAGPDTAADIDVSTCAMRRVLQYKPADLTISVQAGLPWSELTQLLAENRQAVPLDPPFDDTATVGGVVASNSSGPRRWLYGTARDLVIGMQFATLEGRVVQSGGMVVKNVAGLDMAKLMIGSFGTLAAVGVVNFKLQPMPECERTFLVRFNTAAEAVAARNRVLQGPIAPASVDLLSPEIGGHLRATGYALAVQVGGNAAVVDRAERFFSELGDGVALEGREQEALWRYVRNFTPAFLAGAPEGAVLRVSHKLSDLAPVATAAPGPVLARAGSGVAYLYFDEAGAAQAWMKQHRYPAVIEFAPEARKADLDLWPDPGADFAIMERVKRLFDPNRLLNRGRLYRRI